MNRNTFAVGLTTLGLVACGGGESGTPSAVPDPVSAEQAIELIRACRVEAVEASHSGEVNLYLEGGRRVSVADPSSKVWDTAAEESSDGCPSLELFTE